MRLRCRLLMLILALGLVAIATQAVAAEPIPWEYEFLAELATIQPVPGFSPVLFRPESQPSRFEIAFFLFRFDQSLAAAAEPEGLDLTGAFVRIRLATVPSAEPTEAGEWADSAALRYRRLLVEYGHEMGALGYRIRPDAYPPWSRGTSSVLGD